jgi:hypothetical protein
MTEHTRRRRSRAPVRARRNRQRPPIAASSVGPHCSCTALRLPRAHPPAPLPLHTPICPTLSSPPSHAHRVVEAVRSQVGKGIHLQQNCTISRPVVELLEKLNDATPPELSRFFFNCACAGP